MSADPYMKCVFKEPGQDSALQIDTGSLDYLVVRPHDGFPFTVPSSQIENGAYAIGRVITWSSSTDPALIVATFEKLRGLITTSFPDSTLDSIAGLAEPTDQLAGVAKEKLWPLMVKWFQSREWLEMYKTNLFDGLKVPETIQETHQEWLILNIQRAYLCSVWPANSPDRWDAHSSYFLGLARSALGSIPYFRKLELDPPALIQLICSVDGEAEGVDGWKKNQWYWASVLFGVYYFLRPDKRDDIRTAIGRLSPSDCRIFVGAIEYIVTCGAIHLNVKNVSNTVLGWQELVDFCNGAASK